MLEKLLYLRNSADMPNDLFSDVLKLVGAQTVLAGGFAAGGPWALRFPAPDKIKFAALVKGACWLRVEGDDVAIRASDDELLAWAIEDLSAVFGLTIEPVDVRIRRWPDAMPQYGPGHADLIAELRAGLPPTLAVAGSYLDGIGVPACIGAAGRAVTGAIQAVEGSVAR